MRSGSRQRGWGFPGKTLVNVVIIDYDYYKPPADGTLHFYKTFSRIFLLFISTESLVWTEICSKKWQNLMSNKSPFVAELSQARQGKEGREVPGNTCNFRKESPRMFVK